MLKPDSGLASQSNVDYPPTRLGPLQSACKFKMHAKKAPHGSKLMINVACEMQTYSEDHDWFQYQLVDTFGLFEILHCQGQSAFNSESSQSELGSAAGQSWKPK